MLRPLLILLILNPMLGWADSCPLEGPSKQLELFGELIQSKTGTEILKIVPRPQPRIAFHPLQTEFTGLRDFIQSQYSHEIDTVFYPLAGQDSGTPLALFPRAQTIIVLDGNSLELPDKPFDALSDTQFKSYLLFNEIGSGTALFHDLISNLMYAQPTIRFQSFQVRRAPQKQTLWTWFQQTPREATTTIITFDNGPDTPTRQFIHVSTKITPNLNLNKTGWFQWLMAYPPKAVMIRASMEAFDVKQRWQEQGMTLLKNSIVRWMFDRGGILLEGKAMTELNTWEFSGYPPRIQIPTAFTFDQPVPYGYQKSARINIFSED